MEHGFIKAAAVTPKIEVANVSHNTEQICGLIDEAAGNGAKLITFPELCITGYTCGDLFAQDALLERAKEALCVIIEYTRGKDALVFAGLPIQVEGELYNVAAAMNQGKLLGLTSKTFLPNYGEFYERRQFAEGPEKAREIFFAGERVPFGPQLLFTSDTVEELIVSAEICEDVWSPVPPSIGAAIEGATVIVNCSASDETIGKAAYRKSLIKGQSARLIAGYIYANAGEGESTTDVVFGGHNIIAENGAVLGESAPFESGVIYSELDVKRLVSERRKNTTFKIAKERKLTRIPFHIEKTKTSLTRVFPSEPFLPGKGEKEGRFEEILMIQAQGLKKRLAHTGTKSAVIGVSGGLDSTLALLVTAKAFDGLRLSRKGIKAITMPCFGTTKRTLKNAQRLSERLGVSLREIRIADAVIQHFKDIGQDMEKQDTAFENAQARERTQVLMDVANQEGGLVIGTGDMSELALGWATYNGDHMSMYGVNSSVPKTLVRYVVSCCAAAAKDEKLREILLDVLDTPVSPELLPAKDGQIAQRTEDLVGPYDLQDFFLYYFLRFGYEPDKLYRIAGLAFKGKYGGAFIQKWLESFLKRFFSQQFKRSCLPDGPKVGTVGLSPRGDFRMPSDASFDCWMEGLKKTGE